MDGMFSRHIYSTLSLVIVSVIMIWHVRTQVTDAGQKLNDISSAIIDSVENHCQCGFIRDRITDEAFQCTDSASEAVAYAATVHGTAGINSSIFISHIEQWATDGATVTILHEILNISNVGPTIGGCCTEMTVTKEVMTSESSDHYSEEVTSFESSLNQTQAKPKDNDNTLFIIIGGGSGGGVVTIVIIVIVVIAVIVKCKNRKRGKLR